MNHNIAFNILSDWSHSDKIAYRSEDYDITYRNLASSVRQFANWLLSRGLQQDDRVVILFPDCIDSVIYFLGTIWAGGIPCVINTQSSLTNLQYKLDKIRPKFIFREIDDSYHAVSDVLEPAPRQIDDTACLIWSSGTGGNPKAIMIPHGPMLESVKNYAAGMRLTSDEIIYCTAKFFFSYGIFQTIFTSIWCGATSVIDSRMLLPKRIERNIKNFCPTVFLSVPAVYGLMLRATNDTFQHVRCVSSGDILPDTLRQRFQQRFGRGIHSGLGTTETLHIMTLNQMATSGIGQPFQGWIMRLVDSQGQPVSPGEIGFLQIKTRCRATGYWDDPENTKRVFGGEWISLGDMCIQDEQGCLHYVGRSGDLIKYNGQYTNLSAIELLFLTHPDVEQAVVVAATDDLGHSKISAHVVIKEHSKITSEDLREWIKNRCEFDYYPRSIHLVDQIPRNENGKIDRVTLRNQYA